jgi:hypothetical protein
MQAHTPGQPIIEPRRRFTLRSLLIITAALAFTWGMTAHQIRRSHERREQHYARTELPACLARLSYALRLYGGPRGFFTRLVLGNPWPPAIPTDDAGQPLSSWRFLIATHRPRTYGVARPALAARWDSPVNRLYAANKANPYNVNYRRSQPTTQLFAITGPGTAFDGDAVSHFADVPPKTIVVMEVGDSNTHWMQPGDYDVTKLLAATGRLGDTVQGVLNDRIHILFADGEVWALSPDAPIDALKPFLTVTGAKAASREEQLGPYRVND